MFFLNVVSNKLKRTLINLAAKYSFFTPFYYSFFSKEFKDEQHGIITGIYKNMSDRNNLGNFRRNIHRLEKGLITRPSKPIFAQDYILNTVKTFRNIEGTKIDIKTKEWAFGVLNQFFNIAPETDVNKEAKEIFESINQDKYNLIPQTYSVNERCKSNIEYSEFLKLNKQRRSIRYFKNIPVPRELLEKAIKAAIEAPSACNRQPFTYRIIDDPDLLKEAVLLPNGSKTFSDSIKVMIFLIGDLSNYFSERDKHLIYIDSSLSAMSFILALETLGLSSCVVNWADLKSNNLRLKKFLKLENWEKCIMSIAVGYPDDNCEVASSVKKELKTVVKYN